MLNFLKCSPFCINQLKFLNMKNIFYYLKYCNSASFSTLKEIDNSLNSNN